jgi:hypothetical protein
MKELGIYIGALVVIAVLSQLFGFKEWLDQNYIGVFFILLLGIIGGLIYIAQQLENRG